jgi:hypothetical protein
MDNLRKAAGLILVLIMAVMAAVERPGEGAEKKAEAVAALNQIDDVATKAIGLPSWAQTIVSGVLAVAAPMLIDLLVKNGKSSGFFGTSAS